MLFILFHLNVKDTQTGLKVFKMEALKPVAHLIRTSGFAYDIELLVAIHRRGFSIAQMPVNVVYVRDSNTKTYLRIHLRYFTECILNIIMMKKSRIRYRDIKVMEAWIYERFGLNNNTGI